MFHDVGLLEADVKLDSIITLLCAAGADFAIFMWTLSGILFRILFYWFTFFQGMYRAMQQACFICTSHPFTWIECIFFLLFPKRTFLVLIGEAASHLSLFLT